MSEKETNQEGTSNSEEKKNSGEDEVTLGEVLRQQKELDDEYEQEYLEVLGGSDDKMCTYSQVKNISEFFHLRLSTCNMCMCVAYVGVIRHLF